MLYLLRAFNRSLALQPRIIRLPLRLRALGSVFERDDVSVRLAGVVLRFGDGWWEYQDKRRQNNEYDLPRRCRCEALISVPVNQKAISTQFANARGSNLYRFTRRSFQNTSSRFFHSSQRTVG